jgi:uncharacterized protein (TIGR03067 family)
VVAVGLHVVFRPSPGKEVAELGKQLADRQKLRGTWRVVSWERSGKPLPPDEMRRQGLLGRKLTFADDEVVWEDATGRKVHKVYALDPTKSPRVIASDVLPGDLVDMSFVGIYEVEGDTLRLCRARGEPGGLPREFRTAPRSDSDLIVLRRQQP